MTSAHASEVLRSIQIAMRSERARLIDLDAAMGDGDLGITMVKAFEAASAVAIDQRGGAGAHFAKAGAAIASAAPSTMGTLMATGFIRGGRAIADTDDQSITDVLADFFRAFSDGLMDRGKSKPGEKTIVDVVEPVATAMNQHRSQEEAIFAARVEQTLSEALTAVTNMVSQHGKAAVYREQTAGKPDPGAEAGAIVVRAFLSSMVSTNA